ncbi:hypothetical protein ALC56_07099, partial [Trachymyrmex septentrionalis]
RLIVLAGHVDNDGGCSGSAYSDPYGIWGNVVVLSRLKVTLQDYIADVRINDEAYERHAFFHTFSHTFSKPGYISHILMRRYALTLTVYKFLDIGIVVGFTSHVEITICDNRGNCIILPHATRKAFIERRADVERLMQSTVPSSSSPIQDLNVELIKVCDTKNVKLSSSSPIQDLNVKLIKVCDTKNVKLSLCLLVYEINNRTLFI